MSDICQLTGKSTVTGNNVSHSQRKTKRTYKANISKKEFYSELMQKNLHIKASAYGARCVEKAGGIDNFLYKAKQKRKDKLGQEPKKILKLISKKKSLLSDEEK